MSNQEHEHITNEPTRVEWVGGLDNEWAVEVDPYAGTVTVNGEKYDVGVLEEGPPIHVPPEERIDR